MVLFTRNTEELCEYRQAMRDIVRANRFSSDLVRLTCLLAERQQQFVSSLIKGATEQLVDENAATLFTRIANNIIELSEVRRDNLTKDELIPAARLVLTVTDIIAGGYVVSYLVKSREENVQKQLGLQGPTRVYMSLHGPTRAYRGLQGSTWAYRGLWGPTGAYRSVGESRNHQTQMSLIKDHFTHSHF